MHYKQLLLTYTENKVNQSVCFNLPCVSVLCNVSMPRYRVIHVECWQYTL